MNLIPLQYRLAAKVAGWALVAIALWALYSWVWNRGADHVQARWDAAVAQAQLDAANTGQQQAKATVKVVTEYVDRVRTVHVQGDTIIKEIPIYVPSDSACDLPTGWRLLHDAAAAGAIPDPAGLADEAPVEPQAAAEGVISNYAVCHQNAEQLLALQEWVRQMQSAGR